MISTAISITKYENEAALEERREEEVDDDDDDDNDSVEKAAGAHNTREGGRPRRRSRSLPTFWQRLNQS